MSLIPNVNDCISRGHFAQAADIAAEAVAAGEQHPVLFNVLAFRESEAGRFDAALGLLGQGLRLAPRDAHLLYSAGLCLFNLGRDNDAIGLFNAAMDARPGFAAPLQQKGLIFERAGEEAAAERCYAEAHACDPGYEDPLAGLASIAAGRGDFVRARDFAQRALAIAPGQVTAHLALARADFDDGALEAVVARLSPLIDAQKPVPADRPAFLALLGDALDGLDRREEAFAAWTEAKRLDQERYAGTSLAQAARQHLDRLEALAPLVTLLAGLPGGAGPTPTRPDAPRRHVFLVGFPRSGTTLLEQILASHPDVVALEERPLLEPAEMEFLATPAGFQRLLAAGEPLLEPFRELYWRRVKDEGLNVRGKVFIDKLPLGSLLIPLIVRLFPDARILFAERDPRDVALSCFRRNFKMNPGMYQFVTLEGTARFYDRVMTLATAYRRLAGGRVHTVRYETLVADFETQAREACAFIGLDWREEMRSFAEKAKTRTIRTPSAAQVRKGLYATGAGQWRRYADALAPVSPVLTPWVESLGYAAEPA